MIIAWIGYCLLVSALLGLAAFSIERALGHYRRPVRGVWAAALAGSAILPVAAYVAPALLARFATVTPSLSAGLATAIALPDVATATTSGFDWGTLLANLGLVLGVLWGLSVVAFAAHLVVTHRRLRREMDGWTPGEILEAPVLLSPDRGPAIVGVGKGVIVMPAWISELEEKVLRLVFLHELEHQRAGDHRLFSLGLLGVIAMPWNPFAWWQLRRLRLAIEFDCDRRVMARDVDPREYAEALLAVGSRLAAPPLAAAAFAERRPAVERRLRRMTEPLRRLRGLRAVGAIGVGGLAVLFACGSPLPTETPLDAEFTVTEIEPEAPQPSFIPYDKPPIVQNRDELPGLLSDLYPADLKAQGIGGRAEFWLHIDEDGNVAHQQVKTPSGIDAFDKAALELVQKMEFEPAANVGVRTDVWISQWVTFGEVKAKPRTDSEPGSGEELSLGEAGPGVGPEPLIVIDGVIQAEGASKEELGALDIDHIEIIKGPAAGAMYGDRARDGVIQVTTKNASRPEPEWSTPGQNVGFDDVDQDGAPDLIVATGVTGITRDPDAPADAPRPLIVIDGVLQADDTTLSDVGELDIDRVEIVKGAAALRLYGDRGRDGVVQIITKSGGTL